LLFLVDIALSILVALVLVECLVRAFRLHGPWQRRPYVGLVVFLAAWGGGVWFAPGSFGDVGWIAYSLPFVLVGLVAALVIVIISPLHALTTSADQEAFEREKRAVDLGLTLFIWSLCAFLLAVVVWSYWTR
jgi:uncharacterized membrane protein